MTRLNELRLEQQEPRTKGGMVFLIGPLGTCVGLFTRAYAKEVLAEHTDEHGICTFCIEELD